MTAFDLLPGSECVDPEDPNFIAETELLGAAASIEAAAKKLEQLKPRAKPKVTSAPLNLFLPHKHPPPTHTHTQLPARNQAADADVQSR